MAKQLITWQEKKSGTAYDTIYPETLVEQVHINNEIANNLGISPDTTLDTALSKVSETDKVVRAQGVATGTSTALELSTNIFTLFDGVVVRVKVPFDTDKGLTLNVNNTGAKYVYRIDGLPIDLVLKSGAWCTFIYSSQLDGWVLQGWSTKPVLKTEVITKTQTWTVPEGVTSVNVFLFGGGGGSGASVKYPSYSADTYANGYGGGGGGGYMAKSTLTVTPGQSVPVTIGAGGAVSKAGGTTSFGSLLSANGGSAGGDGTTSGASNGYGGKGGDGGSGGGGSYGSHTVPYTNPSSRTYLENGGAGGTGGQFGGGGGGIHAKGGNGGQYGGGGGAGLGSTAGTGGTYGGAGGAPGKAGSNGTDTTNVADIEFRGSGKGGGASDAGGGGGGYGGNGGKGGFYEGGGGGGYGASGGDAGGGGGGYGGKANGCGGGGYGINNYGCGGNSDSAGADGICVITYTAQES